jgi:hypothetical protein
VLGDQCGDPALKVDVGRLGHAVHLRAAAAAMRPQPGMSLVGARVLPHTDVLSVVISTRLAGCELGRDLFQLERDLVQLLVYGVDAIA